MVLTFEFVDGILIMSDRSNESCRRDTATSAEQRGLMSRMRLRKVESTEILFETRENERWRPLSRRS